MDNRKFNEFPQNDPHYLSYIQGRPSEYYSNDHSNEAAYYHQQYLESLKYSHDYDPSGHINQPISIKDYMSSPSNSVDPQFLAASENYGDAKAYHSMYYDQMYQPQDDSMYGRTQGNATERLKQQYQLLQEEKMKLQIRTQNDALLHQQQTFALRQQLNPPVPLSTPQSPTSTISQISAAYQQQKLPPTSLNLINPNQYPNDYQEQPRYLDSAMESQIHMAQMQMARNTNKQAYQMMQSPMQQSQVIIQQNHPSKVVNQAVQTQMSDASQKSSGSTPSSGPQSPVHGGLERRKSESLKSPTIKRPQNSPVTMSGFLYKQGSEGLKVWKKRYFILSEYCLFYYKGTEQEKLLGSVLLPSYSISICLPEDRINRKYAFSLSHTNMRTYVLAAETLEQMDRWMKVLTMATLMQESTESSVSSINQSCSDSGIQTYHSHQGKIAPVTPVTSEKQPLYMNAPPKPTRRVTGDIGYSSPSSPDVASQIYDNTHKSYKNSKVDTEMVYGTRDNVVTMNVLRTNQPKSQMAINANMHKLMISKNVKQHNASSEDRRTPEEYTAQQSNKYNYEDIYNPALSPNPIDISKNYRRPPSPPKASGRIEAQYLPEGFKVSNFKRTPIII